MAVAAVPAGAAMAGAGGASAFGLGGAGSFMSSFGPELFGGLLGAGGGLFSGFMGKGSADDAAHAMKRAMQHRYSWMVKDLRRAGLNPILAVSGGNPGGVPGFPTSTFPNIFEGASSSAVGYRGRVAEASLMRAQESSARIAQLKGISDIGLNAANANAARSLSDKYDSESMTNRTLLNALLGKLLQDTATGGASARKMNAEARLRELDETQAALEAELARKGGIGLKVFEKYAPSAGAVGSFMDWIFKRGDSGPSEAPRRSGIPSTMHRGR